ncbi:hypothetical protein HPB48_003748 [Haemaphysalis longicornis]|uniref:Transposase n=1 Tax=Haemaphysalis longicornis TaxID=44386 RepID=A0A9J6FFS2_HAELO|nr:hypothetical protein HPB48_003748 [Haemaphysalis longicornis]
MRLPGTNAPVEGVFSLMNTMWTTEKMHLHFTTLKAMKVDLHMTCEWYYRHISKNEQLLRAIHSSKGYVLLARENVEDKEGCMVQL